MKEGLNNRIIWFLLVMCLCFVSCGTKQKVISEKKNRSELGVIEQIVEKSTWKGAFSSKIKFNVQFGSASYALNGTLRIKRDEALQLSLQVPLLGMEAVRVEATPEKILIIDRLHKKYVEESVAELSGLSATGLDFYALQSLFTGALFRPGVRHLTVSEVERMQVNSTQSGAMMNLNTIEKGLDYQFDIAVADVHLAETRISKASTAYKCVWKYSNYQELSGRAFPLSLKASFEGAPKVIGFEMDLSRPSTSSDWSVGSSLSSRYERIQLKDVMKLFSTL